MTTIESIEESMKSALNADNHNLNSSRDWIENYGALLIEVAKAARTFFQDPGSSSPYVIHEIQQGRQQKLKNRLADLVTDGRVECES